MTLDLDELAAPIAEAHAQLRSALESVAALACSAARDAFAMLRARVLGRRRDGRCTFWDECEPTLEGLSISACRERCETDEAWDWTDECGDLRWEARECLASLTCEEARDDPDIPGADNPYQSHFDEFQRRGCTYDRSHGD